MRRKTSRNAIMFIALTACGASNYYTLRTSLTPTADESADGAGAVIRVVNRNLRTLGYRVWSGATDDTMEGPLGANERSRTIIASKLHDELGVGPLREELRITLSTAASDFGGAGGSADIASFDIQIQARSERGSNEAGWTVVPASATVRADADTLLASLGR